MMNCPKCKQPIDVIEEMKKWFELYKPTMLDGAPAVINMSCANCKEEAGIWLSIDPYSKTEEIDTPVGKVKLPVLELSGTKYAPEETQEIKVVAVTEDIKNEENKT